MRIQPRKFVVAVLVGALSLGMFVGGAVAGSREDEMFLRVRGVYDAVNSFHKDGADLDKFTAGAIKGGLDALGDPHTNYFTDEEYRDFLGSLNGNFSGIGAYLEQDENYVVISSPIKGAPAERAGLMSGDRILEVDNVSLVGASTEKAVKYIRGTAGTAVTLKIERPSEKRTFTVQIVREAINLPEVESKMLDGQIAYVQLSSFGDDAVSGFYSAVNDLKQQGAKGLVLDLRQNGGGYLNAAVELASAFVPADQPVVWEQGKDGKTSMTSSGRLIGLPTAVLVDNGSASASEILAGAIQDHKAAPLVGVKTYGKGTVQQFVFLSTGGTMKITIAEYLTPKERHVDKVGLIPEYIVENPTPDVERISPLELKRLITPWTAGLDVLYIQYRLQDLGYTPDTAGYFGISTLDAAKKFAEDNGLKGDPLISEQFIQALNQKVAENARQAKQKDLQLEKAVELVKAQMKK
ncbi:MAG TPA: S41 family peptidase [Symbiobacteriaceae bacterium]|nr:S41 family peptidase [Symbiobacteriaceae bacterium]